MVWASGLNGRRLFATWQILYASPERTISTCMLVPNGLVHVMRVWAECKNGYSAPFIPGYNNNTKKGIGISDLSHKISGASTVEMCWF